MAEKTISYRVDIKATEDSRKKLIGLQNEFDKSQQALRKLNKEERKSGGVTAKSSKARADLTTKLHAQRNALNDHRAAILKSSNALRKNSGFVKGVTKGMAGFAKSMIGPFLAIGALKKLFSSTVGVIKRFEKGQSDLASVLGVSKDEIEELSNQAKDLGASTRFTASEVLGLQKELAKLGFEDKNILDMTDAVLQLAGATGTELARSAEVVGSTLRAFNLEAEDSQMLVDTMAKAFSSSSLDMEKFATAMSNVAPVAKNAGLNIQQTTALLGVLTDKGIDASTAGTGLRNVFLELTKKGLTFDQAMEKINKSTNKNKTALELFGKRGAVVGTILAETGDKATDLEKALNNAGGAAQKMADEQLDNLTGKTDLANSAWEGFILSLDEGDGVLSRVIGSALTGITNLLEKLTDLGKTDEQLLNKRVKIAKEIGIEKTEEYQFQKKILFIQDKSEKVLLRLVKQGKISKGLVDTELSLRNKGLGALEREVIFATALNQSKKKEGNIKEDNLLLDEKSLTNRVKESMFDKKTGLEISSKYKRLMLIEELALKKADIEIVRGSQEVARTHILNGIKRASSEELIRLSEVDIVNKKIINALALDEIQRRKEVGAIINQNAEKETGAFTEKKKQLKAFSSFFKEALESEAKEVEYWSKDAVRINNEQFELEKKLLNNSTDLAKKELEVKAVNKDVANSVFLQLELSRLQAELELNKIYGKDTVDIERGILEKKHELRLEAADTKKTDQATDTESDQAYRDTVLQAEQAALGVLSNAHAAYIQNKRDQDERATQRYLDSVNNKADTEIDIIQNQLDKGIISEEEFAARKNAIDKKREADELKIKKQAFEKKRKLDQAVVTFEFAKELASIAASASANPTNAVTYGAAGAAQYAILAAVAAANFAINTAMIQNAKFARGGILNGPSHSAGGVDLGYGNEGQGGEAIINVESTKKHKALLSAINVDGGGVAFGGAFSPVRKFAGGGVLGRPSPSSADIGGSSDISRIFELMAQQTDNIVRNIRVQNVVTDTSSVLDSVIDVENQVTLG